MAPLLRIVAFVGLILALEVTTSSATGPSCGANITNSTVLTKDLVCNCSQGFPYLLHVKGPATLNLKEFTVKCSNASTSGNTTCIEFSGKGVTIKNGYVTNCLYGIRDGVMDLAEGALLQNMVAEATSSGGAGFFLSGENHTLLDVHAENNTEGLRLLGSNNKVKESSFLDSDFGIRILGANNTIASNSIEHAKSDCVYLHGAGNVFKDNHVVRCGGRGVAVDGRNSIIDDNSISVTGGASIEAIVANIFANHSGIQITSNSLSKSKTNCIVINSGFSKTHLEDNLIADCTENGVLLNAMSSRSTVLDNGIRNCGSTGVTIFETSNNTVSKNKITNCTVGIKADNGARKNTMESNLIIGSGLIGIFLSTSSSESKVKDNGIRNCGVGVSVLNSSNNTVTSNGITKCKVGIKADIGATNNRFTFNRVSDSFTIALQDLTAKCGSNVWKGNSGRGNRGCTKN